MTVTVGPGRPLARAVCRTALARAQAHWPVSPGRRHHDFKAVQSLPSPARGPAAAGLRPAGTLRPCLTRTQRLRGNQWPPQWAGAQPQCYQAAQAASPWHLVSSHGPAATAAAALSRTRRALGPARRTGAQTPARDSEPEPAGGPGRPRPGPWPVPADSGARAQARRRPAAGDPGGPGRHGTSDSQLVTVA